jgi:hypothetical protein
VEKLEQDRVLQNPLNAGVLAYRGRGGAPLVVSSPESASDPYTDSGSHPDVVSRIWDELGASMPTIQRCLIRGTPALISPVDGLVLAVALGTAYALRLAPNEFRDAIRAGAKTEHLFSTARVALDLPSTLGEGWVFGSWHENEQVWCASSWEALSA